jgi:hypothetical protein
MSPDEHSGSTVVSIVKAGIDIREYFMPQRVKSSPERQTAQPRGRLLPLATKRLVGKRPGWSAARQSDFYAANLTAINFVGGTTAEAALMPPRGKGRGQ